MKLPLIVAGLLLVLAAAVSWILHDAGDGRANRRLVLTGSSTIAPLLGEIAKLFEAGHPGVRVDVQSGGSSRGLADARSGVADIGMVSRALSPAEDDLLGFPIALDGIGLILHASNPVAELTNEQVVAIFRGNLRNWSAVGGHDLPITVINKAEGRSTLEVFTAYFGLKSSEIEATVVIGDNEQGILTVAANPGAIGYVSIGTAELDAGLGVPIKLLPVNRVAASTTNVRNGTFPLSRQLTLVTTKTPSPLALELIAFARSPAARQTVSQQYFVPIAN